MSKLLELLGAERYTFQTFDDSPEKRGVLARTLNGKYEDYIEQLKKLNEHGAGIFVTINETDGKGRKSSNIKRARAIWIDQDNDKVTLPNLPPTLTVETSPDKHHYYWIFTEATDNWDQWEQLQQTMVTKFGSDPSVRDRARVLRLPGFYHKKDKDQSFRVSEKVSGNKYPFSILVKEFGLSEKVSQGELESLVSLETPTDSVLDQAVQKIISGANFNDSLDTLSMHMANKQYSGYFIQTMLSGLMAQTQCQNKDRVKARNNHLPTYVRTALSKARHTVFKPTPKDYEYGTKITDIPMPPGMLGRITENVMEFMRFPNKEIAILTALHTVSVFAGRRYTFLGKGLTAKRILLARQGIGKNTTNKYIQACVYGLQMPSEGSDLPRLIDAHKYLISGDFTAVRPIHQELEEFATRSMILSEAGQVGKSDAGDKLGLKAYMLQLLSRGTHEFILPKRYSVKKGDNELRPVYNPCAVILHESVPDNYAEVMRDGGEFSDGSMARSDLIYVDFERTKVQKNLSHSSATVKPEILDYIANLAQRSLRGIPQEGTVPVPPNQMVEADFESDQVKHEVETFDEEVDKLYDAATNDIDTALYVRKMERFFITALILAVAEDPESPKVKMEHIDWVKAYQKAMETTIKSFALGGSFSDSMEQALQAIREIVVKNLQSPGKTYIRGLGEMDLIRAQREQLFTRKFLADSLSNNPQIKKYADLTSRGNKRAAYNTLISEMISQGEVKMLTKDEKEGVTGDLYQFLYKVSE